MISLYPLDRKKVAIKKAVSFYRLNMPICSDGNYIVKVFEMSQMT